ncbi:MAG: HAD family hydrolase [Lachnospiraceae bacterium]|nr:HAD family hydrolase [Lachnospiraceae bacterium]
MEKNLQISKEVLKKIKLVCSDIDGTLVEEGKGNLNPEYYTQIRRLKEKGIRFAVVSGRNYESARPLFEPVLEDVLFINDNGAVIRFQDKVHRYHTVEPGLVQEIVKDMAARPGCSTYVSAMEGNFAWKGDPHFCELLRRDYQLKVKEIDRMPEGIPSEAGVMSFGLYYPGDVLEAVGGAFMRKWNSHPKVEVMAAGEMWLNVCQRGIHKGSALAEIMEEYGLKREEVLAFGDNMNDYGMLSSIPNSVAVGNARKEIKDISRYVADTNVNDGVLQILRQL